MRVVDHADGKALTEEMLDILRIKAQHDHAIYKAVASSFGRKPITTLTQYFTDLAVVQT